MSAAGHKRRHKHEEHDEHVNHERWLVSYADMLTVLMALFIVLFALSQVDVVKFAQFKAGMNDGESASNLVLPGNDGINQVDNGEDPVDLAPFAGGDPMQSLTIAQAVQQAQDAADTQQSVSDLQKAIAEVAGYRELEARIDQALAAGGDQDQVTYRITSDGLVIGLVADNVFFENASADVMPTGLDVLDVVGPVLAPLPNEIAVQGHTNSLPLRGNARYRDNWDLSSARANSVLTHFTSRAGISDQRLSSTGYGSARPLYPDADPRALAGNRRVDLVVASPSSESVKALLPQVAQSTPTDGPAELDVPSTTGSTTGTTTGAAAAVPASTTTSTTTGTTTETHADSHSETTTGGH
ncbi:OmpA/MotB family protein [Kineococcus terrestris]|uniref:OmpA/MotB family protein n=1 Tax=Kineococcus terrestris TaxID=2044856 RepID=UPI0034DB0489